MTKEELFKMMNEHPVMYVATNENGQPHVRAILMFKADADGIVFHTGVTKDLYRQLLADPRSEVCFACGKYQVRVEGKFELVEEMALKEEIVNHPSRKFLKPWREQQGDEAFFGFLKVFRMQHGKAHVWCMEDNFKPKEYIELQDMNEFMTPPKHVNFRAKKLFGAVGNIVDGAVAYMDLDGGGPTELHTHEHNHLFIVTEGEAKILLGDEEVIIHKDEAFLVEGRIPHSCWNNIEGVTKMIGITVI